MTHEDLLANINTLENQIKEATSIATDKYALKALRTAAYEIKEARRGVESLLRVEKILEGIESWRTQIYKS